MNRNIIDALKKEMTAAIQKKMSDKSKGRGGLFFFNTCDVILKKEDAVDVCACFADSHAFYWYNFEDTPFVEPYWPFLNLIQTICRNDKINIEKLINKSGVYYFQKEMFSSFINENRAVRREELLNVHYRFESQKVKQSLLSLLSSLVEKKPLILFLNDLHFASLSTLNFLYTLSQIPLEAPLIVITTFNRMFRYADNESNNRWERFLQKTDQKIKILDCTIPYSPSFLFYTKSKPPVEYIQSVSKVAVTMARNSLQFMAFSECKELCMLLYENMLAHKITISSDDLISLLLTMAESSFIRFELDKSMLYLNTLLGEVLKSDKKEILTIVYNYLARCYNFKSSYDIGRRYANMAIKIARSTKNRVWEMHGMFILYRIALINKVPRVETRKLYNKTIALSRELGQQLTLINLFYPVDFSILPIEKLQKNCESGIKLSRKFGDFPDYVSLKQFKAIIHFHNGEYDKALLIMRKVPGLWKKLKNDFSYSTCHNTIGYLYFLKEQYSRSYKYFQKALDLLKRGRYRNELIITVFNIALLFAYSRQFDKACVWFKRLLSLVQLFGFETFPYHTLNSVYALLGIMYCRTGQNDKAVDLYNRLMAVEPSTNDEELVFTALFSAMILRNKGGFNPVKKEFENCLDIISNHKNDMVYNCIKKFVLIEYGEYCAGMGELKSAEQIFNEGLELSKVMGHPFYTDLFTLKKTDPNAEIPRFLFSIEVKIDQYQIRAIVKHDDNVKQMHKNMYELNLLNTVQYYVRSQNKREILISMVMI